ncbi:MAG: efflux RND transporter permease subunit, partial [Planctomycetes bacterium]|nr:efflux RND transporter permease subunit [Planctomycetota bacterium]
SFVVNLGGFVRQYQVFLKPEMLHHYGITIGDVKEAIEQSNRNFSGGIITHPNQEFLIKGQGRIESLEHIANTVITSHDNVPVHVSDVADVKVGARFARGNAGFNGRDAVSVVLQKQYGGDTLQTINNVKQFLSELDLPDKTDVVTYYDQSVLINSSLRHLGVSMLEGGVLVLAVILLFLWSVRASLIASLTIPLSLLFALALMYVAGISLTVMALGGLAIGIGKMAGGSVIMVENIHKYQRSGASDGSLLERTSRGAKEVGPYLFSANLIIVLVFLPLLTLGGIAGRMFQPTVYALVAALIGSLVINITLQPVLMSFARKPKRGSGPRNVPMELATRLYVKCLTLCFRLKPLVLIAMLAIVLVAADCYRRLGSEFVPFLDEGSMLLSTVMSPDTSLEESVRVGKRIEKVLLSYPEVVNVCRTTGMAEESEHVHPVNHSHFVIELRPLEQRRRGYAELTEAIRAKLDSMPGIRYMFEQPIANKMAEMLTGTEGKISLKLFGPDLEVLDRKTREMGAVMSRMDGVADLQIEETTGIPLILVDLDRDRLAPYGMKVEAVADTIETALNGVEVTDVIKSDRITAVMLRLPDENRHDVETVKNLLLDTPSGHGVPLSDVARVSRSEGPQTIFREDLMRRKTIVCNVVNRDAGGFVREAQSRIKSSVALPQGYFFAFGGEYESQRETMEQLTWTMLIVTLGVLLVLFGSLGSLRQSLLLLLNIPMTLAGGLIALYLTDQTLNVSSMIGFIALFGIALQNGVVLVGKINDLRGGGVELRRAVMEGAAYRFRPILMTELILILGVLPLALARTSGSEIHRPLAVVYIGGFLVAIFFEQFALPILYQMVSSSREKFARVPG